MKKILTIFDIDSTLISIESLDYLLGYKSSELVKNKLKEITDLGMNSKIPFIQSVEQRIKLGQISKDDIQSFANEIISFIDKDIRDIILTHKNKIDFYFISGGIRDLFIPAIKSLGIDEKYLFANTPIYDENEILEGYDYENFLAKDFGKYLQLKDILKNNNHVYDVIIAIGDGSSDLELFQKKICSHFIGYTLYQEREVVKKNAPFIASNGCELKKIYDGLIENENFTL